MSYYHMNTKCVRAIGDISYQLILLPNPFKKQNSVPPKSIYYRYFNLIIHVKVGSYNLNFKKFVVRPLFSIGTFFLKLDLLTIFRMKSGELENFFQVSRNINLQELL